MHKTGIYILLLFMALAGAVKSFAQSTQPDVVCVGATKNYYVIATLGSKYIWKVNDGAPEPFTSNSIEIKWTSTGKKTLTVQEITKDNCVGAVQSLQVIVNEPSHSKTFRKICPLQFPFKWNGLSCTSAGVYRTTLTNAMGCDSIAELELVVEDPMVTRLEQRICKSELPFTWYNQQINGKGTYNHKLITTAGCDSIVYLTVDVPEIISNVIKDTICVGESCEFAGKNFYNPGSYTEIMKNEFGCDSIVTLHLTVETGKTIYRKLQLYTGESIDINGEKQTTAGTYAEKQKAGAKCADETITELTFIDVPNAFTPNGDDKNEIFMAGHRVKIYNRNGILIHEGNNGWDGKYKGNLVSKDTYYYVLFNEDPEIKPKEGYITVLR